MKTLNKKEAFDGGESELAYTEKCIVISICPYGSINMLEGFRESDFDALEFWLGGTTTLSFGFPIYGERFYSE